MHLNTTTCAPSEQPGAKRKEEMNALYGKHASTIMSLEASLQLNYDKNCDMRQPIFWPSIPSQVLNHHVEASSCTSYMYRFNQCH